MSGADEDLQGLTVGHGAVAVGHLLEVHGAVEDAPGLLDLAYEAMELPSDPGLTLLVYTAEPGSPTQDALDLLASWAATLDQDERTASEHADRRS